MISSEKARLLEKMKVVLSDGNYDQCLSFANEILKHVRNHFEALSYKGLCLCRLGHLDEAINILTDCINKSPNLAHLWVFRGDCYYDQHAWQKSFDDYSQSLRLDPSNGAVMDKCARCLFKLGDVNYALHFIQKAVSRVEDPNPFIIMIAMLNELGFLDYAKQIAQMGAEAFPNDERFKGNAAASYFVRPT